MIHAPRLVPPRRQAHALLAAVFLTLISGCRKDAPPAPMSEDPSERLKSAMEALRRAHGAPIPEKFDNYRRVIALYDDTPVGRDAHFELVVTLVRDDPPQTAAALDVARKFADRHPNDARVGEAFLQVADVSYYAKHEATRTAALDAWARHLEARDIAGDVAKWVVFADFVRLRLRQERWADAEVAIDTALGQAELPKADRVEILVRKGSLLSEKLGNKPGARAAFDDALRLSREVHASGAGRMSIPPAQIEEEIRKLGG
jgi:hypothetical protein